MPHYGPEKPGFEAVFALLSSYNHDLGVESTKIKALKSLNIPILQGKDLFFLIVVRKLRTGHNNTVNKPKILGFIGTHEIVAIHGLFDAG